MNCSLQSTHLIDRSANSDASPFLATCDSMSDMRFTSPLARFVVKGTRKAVYRCSFKKADEEAKRTLVSLRAQMRLRKRGHSGCHLYDYAQLVSSIFLRRTKRGFATFDLCVSLIAFVSSELDRSHGSTRRRMRILTIGSGGREHALVWALRKTSTRA